MCMENGSLTKHIKKTNMHLGCLDNSSSLQSCCLIGYLWSLPASQDFIAPVLSFHGFRRTANLLERWLWRSRPGGVLQRGDGHQLVPWTGRYTRIRLSQLILSLSNKRLVGQWLSALVTALCSSWLKQVGFIASLECTLVAFDQLSRNYGHQP